MNTSQEIDVAFEDMPRTAWATSPHRAKNKKQDGPWRLEAPVGKWRLPDDKCGPLPIPWDLISAIPQDDVAEQVRREGHQMPNREGEKHLGFEEAVRTFPTARPCGAAAGS